MSAFVYDAVRTPFGRFGGGLADERPDDLAATVLAAVAHRTPGLVPDEVVLGNANGAGEDNRNVARMAVLLAGYPVTVPGSTVNRLCGSSLQVRGEGGQWLGDYWGLEPWAFLGLTVPGFPTAA
jgi:acetyl-CoA acyltransferase